MTVQEISPHQCITGSSRTGCVQSVSWSADQKSRCQVCHHTLSPCHPADDGSLLQEPRCPLSPSGSPSPPPPRARPRPCPLDLPPGVRPAPVGGYSLPPPPATRHPWPMEATRGTAGTTAGTAGMGTTGRRHRAHLAV